MPALKTAAACLAAACLALGARAQPVGSKCARAALAPASPAWPHLACPCTSSRASLLRAPRSPGLPPSARASGLAPQAVAVSAVEQTQAQNSWTSRDLLLFLMNGECTHDKNKKEDCP